MPQPDMAASSIRDVQVVELAWGYMKVDANATHIVCEVSTANMHWHAGVCSAGVAGDTASHDTVRVTSAGNQRCKGADAGVRAGQVRADQAAGLAPNEGRPY